MALVWGMAALLLAVGGWQLQRQLRHAEAREFARAARDLSNLALASQRLVERSLDDLDVAPQQAQLVVDPGHFMRDFDRLDLGRFGRVSLHGLDGAELARRAADRDAPGHDDLAPALRARLAAGAADGVYRESSAAGEVTRTIAFRRLQRFPMVLVLAEDTTARLAAQSRAAAAKAAQAAAAAVAVLLLAAWLSRHLLRQRRPPAPAPSEAPGLHPTRESLDVLTQVDSVFQCLPEGIVAFDAPGRVKLVNPAFLRLAGAAPGGLEGLDASGFIDWLSARCDASLPVNRIATLGVGQDPAESPDPVCIRTIHRSRVLQVQAFEPRAGSLSRVLHFRDATRETEAERARGDFLFAAAHELRTPMASIYGFSEMLLTSGLTQTERAEFQSIVFEQSGHLARMLDEILDLARIESRRAGPFKGAEIDALVLAQDAVRRERLPPGRDAPRVESPGGPLPLFGDVDRLRQALSNVLSNAYRFSPRGGPVRVLLTRRVTAGVAWVGIQVIDQGVGMSPDQVVRVGERFYRADKAGQRPGSGLGMSLVHEIVKLHGGRVQVESIPGRGTNVTLWLPLLPGAAPDAPPTAGRDAATAV